MYPAYHEIAKLQGNHQAVRSINYALKSEVDHKGMYTDAREQVLAGKDIADAAGERVPCLRPHDHRRRAGQVPVLRRADRAVQDLLSRAQSTNDPGRGRPAGAAAGPVRAYDPARPAISAMK